MTEKEKAWSDLSIAWDRFIKSARKYCKLSTQFQCDAELIGYCIAQLPWDTDDMDDILIWIRQGVDFGETQKTITKEISKGKK